VKRLDGKVAIVVGGATGIGKATVRRLASEGASVAIGDVNLDGAQSVVDAVQADGGRALAVQTDASQAAAMEELVARTVAEFGGLDVIHNNAALVSPDALARDQLIADFDEEFFDRAVAVNLKGVILGCRYAIPRMLERGGGSIVNTASVSGVSGMQALPIYGMTKAAVIALTKYVATQYGAHGIRCNAVAPGSTASETFRLNVPEERFAEYAAKALIPRVGEPEDIAAAVAYLASDDASYVTGHTLAVDGGRLAYLP
jgi:NAD(P)-dependent dehydrogenase (short-subunit alcohol dehydrogenase family)